MIKLLEVGFPRKLEFNLDSIIAFDFLKIQIQTALTKIFAHLLSEKNLVSSLPLSTRRDATLKRGSYFARDRDRPSNFAIFERFWISNLNLENSI